MSSKNGHVAGVDAWGNDNHFSVIDRFGTWLNVRSIRGKVGSFAGKQVADIGCGFQATFARSILDEVAQVLLVDFTLAEDLKAHPKVKAILGKVPEALANVPAQSLDVVICNNVLEHLWEPSLTLNEVRRMLRPGGMAYVNVPSWRGKTFLELAAFRLRMTSFEQIDDHKTYYNREDLWRLVVSCGFKPSRIECRTHKFGLNTFAVCTV